MSICHGAKVLTKTNVLITFGARFTVLSLEESFRRLMEIYCHFVSSQLLADQMIVISLIGQSSGQNSRGRILDGFGSLHGSVSWASPTRRYLSAVCDSTGCRTRASAKGNNR
jgi:hypothetical protein